MSYCVRNALLPSKVFDTGVLLSPLHHWQLLKQDTGASRPVQLGIGTRFYSSSLSASMTLHDQAAYEALRAYLTSLLLAPSDRPLAAIPLPLRADLEAFLLGKTLYHDASDQPVVYGHDLAAWAHQIVHQTGLTYSLDLATVDVADLTDVLTA